MRSRIRYLVRGNGGTTPWPNATTCRATTTRRSWNRGPGRRRTAGRAATLMQLKQDIDSGATRDKVPVLDPSSTPLGTDAEAAGFPPSPEAVAALREAGRAERRSPLDPTDTGEDPRGLRPLGAIALAVALAALALWFSFG